MPYGVVVEVMGHIKAVGIEKLGVMAEQVEAVKSAIQGKP